MRGFFGGAVMRARTLGRFCLLVLHKARRDNIALIASALAFITILSFVPLLAAFSFVGDRVFERFEERILEFLSGALPYSEEAVLRLTGESLEAARALSGLGWLALFVTALLAFATVEQTLNRIWGVPRQRSFRVRFLSFTLLLFWGPILIGLGFTGLPVLSSALGGIEGGALRSLLTFALSVVGLTVLYAMVPYTPVSWRAAFTGGIVATLLLALLRAGFAHYVTLFRNVNVIYGSFAVSILFMLSVSLGWAIALLGGVVAYTAQNFRALARREQGYLPLEGRWAGLAWLVLLAEDFRRGEAVVPLQSLADRLQVPLEALSRVAGTLLEQGWIKMVPGAGTTCSLAVDPHRLTVAEVFSAYDRVCSQLLEPVAGGTSGRLAPLVGEVATGQQERLASLTVAELARPAEE